MIKTIALYQIQAKEVFKEMRKKAIRQVETTSWLSRQTKSKVMQKLATTKVGSLAKVFTRLSWTVLWRFRLLGSC